MMFMYLISWVAVVIQMLFLTIGVGAGLYYLAELVEEYTVIAKKVIMWMTNIVLILYGGFIIFEEMPFTLVTCGVLSQVFHHLILRNFPYFDISSVSFIGAVCLFFINHYLAFSYFSFTVYTFSEVMGYFTLCLWLVPFALFVSLSANDNVLPSYAESNIGLDGRDGDVVSNYLSRKSKRYGLLGLFHYVSEYFFPSRVKKIF
ncbi:protein TEX261 [Rhodnius prolixus]|uniref:Protein TEX261 n=1 Tax=Rhodnius prolixus TaxID=13249 RepID=R4G8M3_RHOPR